jgi:hypothetical protein
MTIEKRSPEKEGQPGSKLPIGILSAKVVGYLDPSFTCGLEVTLLRENGNDIGDTGQSYPVKYASPFYGSTAYENMGMNVSDFNDTQKTYGMWFPTVEIGTTVLVAFVNGEASEGYFIACIPGRFMNQMIPAIGGSTAFEATAEQKKKYDTTQPLPVGEINRKANTLEKGTNTEKIKKAVHPIADRFLEQGLLEDDARGVTTSSGRRMIPNSVFGISTPGPFDRGPNSKKQFVGSPQSKSPVQLPASRLGGTTLVMDDGDDRYIRKKPAGTGPVEYADVENKEKGDVNIPYNEYFRIRTRTGHQILLHNSEDLIYIGNAKGTTWIELTSNGKIDIFAQDSISIHTENDLNFKADRDINFEAGRNVNIKSIAKTHIESGTAMNLFVGTNGNITTTGTMSVISTGATFLTSAAATNINSAAAITVTGASINLNGPAAAKGVAAKKLTTHDNPVTSSKEKWEGKNRYRSKTPVKSIMKRIPMHEPWILHENQAPQLLTPTDTDREV